MFTTVGATIDAETSLKSAETKA